VIKRINKKKSDKKKKSKKSDKSKKKWKLSQKKRKKKMDKWYSCDFFFSIKPTCL
jgi:hypothetical protein